MASTEEDRVRVALRFTGIVLLGFVLVRLFSAWATGTVLEQLQNPSTDPADLDWEVQDRLHAILAFIGPVRWAAWALGAAAAAYGFWLVVRAGGKTRVAAAVAAAAAAVATAGALRFSWLAVAPLSSEQGFETLDVWRYTGLGAEWVLAFAAIAVVFVQTRDTDALKPSVALVAAGIVGPLLRTLGTAEVELVRSLYDGGVGGLRYDQMLVLSADALMAAGLVRASVGADTDALNRACARGLELARTLVWTRVSFAVVAVVASMALFRSIQRSQMRAAFGSSSGSDSDPSSWLGIVGWAGHIEALLGVAFVMALATLVMQRRSRRARVLAGVGASLLLLTAALGAGLSLGMHGALAGGFESGFGPSRLQGHLEMVQSIDPYMRGVGALGMALVVSALVVLGQQAGRDEALIKGVRLITIAVVASVTWIYGKEALAALGMGVLVVGVIALGIGLWALFDLTSLLRLVAESLRDEPPADRDDVEPLGM